MAYSLSNVDSSGLMNVTSSADWLRFGMGGHNVEANAILYRTLQYGLVLANALDDTSVVEMYTNYSTNIKAAANHLLWDKEAGLFRDNETTTLHPQDGNSWAVLANLTTSSSQASTISTNLVNRWGTFGAPAPEAGSTVSPFVGGFELQAHAAAGNSTALLDLCRLQWGYMLNADGMTNSTFIEGYSTDGRLHYAPYTNDPRVSHAHGWSTGPTSALSFFIAGVQLVEAGGAVWRIAPRLGGLSKADAGYRTALGLFSASSDMEKNGCGNTKIETPTGTAGSISIEAPECNAGATAVLQGSSARTMKNLVAGAAAIEFEDVPGGSWTVSVTCT